MIISLSATSKWDEKLYVAVFVLDKLGLNDVWMQNPIDSDKNNDRTHYWRARKKINSRNFFRKSMIMWARSVRQIRYSELWICDNVKLLYKDKYVDMRRLIVEKIFFTSKLLKYSSRIFESLTFLQAERKTNWAHCLVNVWFFVTLLC
jgi:hypothetical protein